MAIVFGNHLAIATDPGLAKSFPVFFKITMIVADVTFWHINPPGCLVVTNYLKALQAIVLILIDSGLLTGDIDLLLYAVNAVEIR